MPEVDHINREYVIKDVVDNTVMGNFYAETIPAF